LNIGSLEIYGSKYYEEFFTLSINDRSCHDKCKQT